MTLPSTVSRCLCRIYLKQGLTGLVFAPVPEPPAAEVPVEAVADAVVLAEEDDGPADGAVEQAEGPSIAKAGKAPKRRRKEGEAGVAPGRQSKKKQGGKV